MGLNMSEIDGIDGCELCGDDSTSAKWQVLEYSLVVPEVRVCAKCAANVANAYNKKHTGYWLTWNNPPAETRYKKAPISRALRKAVFERDAYRCVTCNSHIDLSCDHIIPESKGGETTFENLQTMCMPCNIKKGSKHEPLV